MRHRGFALMGARMARRVIILGFLGIGGVFLAGKHTWFSDLFHDHHAVQVPGALAGITHDTSPRGVQLDSAVADAVKHTPDFPKGSNVVTGFYGSDPSTGIPAYGLIAVDGVNRDFKVDEFMSAFSSTNDGGYVFKGGDSKTVGDVTYVCGVFTYTLHLVQQTGTACFWQDYDVVGIVLAYRNPVVSSTLATTQTAVTQAERKR